MLRERPLSEVVELQAVSAGVEEDVAVALLEAKEVRCWKPPVLLHIRIADVIGTVSIRGWISLGLR